MSDIRDTISNVAKSVTKTSGDLLKTTKLNMGLSSEESKIKLLYREIGKKVHEIYKFGGSLGEYFDEKYIEILTCERKISEFKEQIGVIKGVRNCQRCEKAAERTAEFCPKCGIRFETEPAATAASIVADRQYAEPPIESHAEWRKTPPPPTSPPSMPVAHIPSPPMPTRICRVCKKENETSTKFCLSCGRILD